MVPRKRYRKSQACHFGNACAKKSPARNSHPVVPTDQFRTQIWTPPDGNAAARNFFAFALLDAGRNGSSGATSICGCVMFPRERNGLCDRSLIAEQAIVTDVQPHGFMPPLFGEYLERSHGSVDGSSEECSRMPDITRREAESGFRRRTLSARGGKKLCRRAKRPRAVQPRPGKYRYKLSA